MSYRKKLYNQDWVLSFDLLSSLVSLKHRIQSTVQRIFKCHLICYHCKSITAAGDRILLRRNSKECFLLFTLKSWSVYFPPQPPVPVFMRSELRSDGPDSGSDIVTENEEVANTEEYIMYIAELHFSW